MTVGAATLLPAPFAHLEPFAATWSLATMAARRDRRLNSNPAERQAFYDAMSPCLRDVTAYLDRYPLDEMPEDAQRLLQLALSLVEVTITIEVYNPTAEAEHARSARLVTVRRELDGR